MAFVLHDLFGVAFAEIAAMIDATPEAARQYASRARRRLRGSDASGRPDPGRQRRVVEAFLAASRGGDFDALLRLLAPDVVVSGDAAAVAIGADAELRGRRQVAEAYSGRAQAARLVLLDGLAGAAWSCAARSRWRSCSRPTATWSPGSTWSPTRRASRRSASSVPSRTAPGKIPAQGAEQVVGRARLPAGETHVGALRDRAVRLERAAHGQRSRSPARTRRRGTAAAPRAPSGELTRVWRTG